MLWQTEITGKSSWEHVLFSLIWTNVSLSQVPFDFKLSAEICADDDDDTSRTIEKYVFK